MAVAGWKGHCPGWVHPRALNHPESHPAVATSISVPPIAPHFPWREVGEQELADLFGFCSGNDSREGERWDPEVPAVLLGVNAEVGLLCQ